MAESVICQLENDVLDVVLEREVEFGNEELEVRKLEDTGVLTVLEVRLTVRLPYE